MLTPLEKSSAEMMLKTQQDAHRERMLAKQHQSHLQTMNYIVADSSIVVASR